jgi:hypothetical protein
MEMNVEGTKVVVIIIIIIIILLLSRHPSPLQIMRNKKYPEYVE